MKKVISVLFSFLFVLTLFNSLLLVQAEDLDDVVLVYVEAPEGWENPCVWAWDDDGAGAYANLGWPGKNMIVDELNEGWYYLYVPSNMTNIIVNANEGSIQTGAFLLSGENVWVTITSADGTNDDGDPITVYTGNTSTVKATSGNLPEFIPTKYIYAYVPIDWDTAGIWAWNNASGTGVYTTWPGQEMTLLDDGWFMVEIPDSADRVIINNLVASEGLQTVDLTVGTEDVYVLIDDEVNESGKYEAQLLDSKPVIIEDGITLYITVPTDWENPCLWAWSHPDGTGLYTTWPGEPISLDSESGYYVVEVPSWVNRIILNNGLTGDEAAQTSDGEMIVTESESIYITVGEAGDDGKFAISFSDTSDNGNVDPSDNTDDESNSGVIYYIIGGVVLALAGAGAFIIFKKKTV